MVKRSQKFNKVQTSEPNVCDVDDAEDTISLYGKWQMEPLCLPHAVNGMVPKAGCSYFLVLAFFKYLLPYMSLCVFHLNISFFIII